MKRLWVIPVFIFMPAIANDAACQTLSASSGKWMEYVEELAGETEDEGKMESLYAGLSYLTEHPFELNHVTAEELRQLPFLSDRQIEELLSYKERFGPMLTLYELKNLKEMDFQTIELLLPFVYAGEAPPDKLPFTPGNLLKYGKNEWQARYDRCFQQKKGYLSQPDSIPEQYPDRKYLGEPFYHSFCYAYTFDNRLQAGFTGEKDAGEPLWNKRHKGYDYYSAHFFLKGVKGLKSLAAGDYKASFGQGLVVSQDFTPGRSATVTQAERRTNGFRRHFSTNETDYFRGAAATVAFRHMEYSLFYSRRNMDAAVDGHTFTSLKTDGLHRLERDWEKRHTVPMQTAGGHVRYVSPGLCIGLTALTYSFGHYRIEPAPKPYNHFYFRGNRNINAGIDYFFKRKGLKFYGETAVSQHNTAVATLNALQLTPASSLSFLLLYRYYDRRYQAFFGNAFAQNSAVQNEQGVYTGIRFTPFPCWKFSAYADVFRFPWLKYGVDAPSSGKEYMAQADYTCGSGFSACIRYKYRQKEKNRQAEETATAVLLPYAQQKIRIQCVYGAPDGFLFRTSIDGALYSEEKGVSLKGFMPAQSMEWKPASLPVETGFYAAWFNTGGYAARIYSYEKNILYAFSTPSFYGKGIRLSATFRWRIAGRLSLSAKIAHTHYTDRETTGTDLEEIEGSNKTDANVLLRWKF
jgi:hypothetical protein